MDREDAEIFSPVKWQARQKALLFRGLAVLLNSGVHLVEGLHSLARQAEEPALSQAIATMAGRLAKGQPLHKALETAGDFLPLEVGLVKVGETSGSLHTVLLRLAELCEKGDATRRRLISAMIYPTFVLTLCLILLVFAPVFVFADLLDLLRELKTALPLPTRLFLGFSDLVLSPLFYLLTLAGLGAAAMSARQVWSQPARRMAFEQLLIDLPGVGPALRNALAADVCQAVATCYMAGIPMLRCLTLSREVTWSRLLSQRLESSRVDLQNGHSLSEALSSTGFFSGMSLTILAGGEEVGLIAEALNNVEKTTREAMEHSLESMQKLLEPLVMLFIGVIVGFIAIATLAPTLQVVQGI